MLALDIPELLVAVFSHLDVPTLKSCSMVCRMWREPATNLVWARVDSLNTLVDQSIPSSILQHFKVYPLSRLLYMTFAEQNALDSSANQSQDEVEGGNEESDEREPPEPSPLDVALDEFKKLRVDWKAELSLFVQRTRHVSHLNVSKIRSGNHGLLVMHLLKEHYPEALEGAFPCLTALTFGETNIIPISRALTALPTIEHVALEVGLLVNRLRDWILVCQAAPSLTSFTIKNIGIKDSAAHHDLNSLSSAPFNPTGSTRLLPLISFISSRRWKHITIPGFLAGAGTFTALASLDSLETLTIVDSFNPGLAWEAPAGLAFRQLHTLRLKGTANAHEYFKHITLPSVRHLELEYNHEPKDIARDSPFSYFKTLVKACTSATSVIYTVNMKTKAAGEEFVVDFPESMFEPLLRNGSLEKLVVRLPSGSSMCLSDEFLGRAARSWPQLRELNIGPQSSERTSVTLQGLVPFARYCTKLRSLQIGIQPNHIHTVFNAELYEQENEQSQAKCPLVYLNVGCPSVYSATTISPFFSALFPQLRHIELPESPDSTLYTRGDYFAWSQVAQAMNQRYQEVDRLARLLRSLDSGKNDESCDSDLTVPSIDDSDEDYWAYSGSEDESYSSDD